MKGFRNFLKEGNYGSDDMRKDEDAYTEFFNKKLKKYGVKSPDELSDDDRKKFFDEIDSEWEAMDEAMSKQDELFGKAFAAMLKKWKIPSIQAIYHDDNEYMRFMDDVKKEMERLDK